MIHVTYSITIAPWALAACIGSCVLVLAVLLITLWRLDK